MLDIKLIRERPDFVKAELAKRGVEPAEVDRLLDADLNRRKLQDTVDRLRALRKLRAREVGKLPPDERAAVIAQIRTEEANEEKMAASIATAKDQGIRVRTNNPLVDSAAELALAE